MMEAVQSSETLVNLYQSTRRYSPEDSHLQGDKHYRSVKSVEFLDQMNKCKVLKKDCLPWSLYCRCNADQSFFTFLLRWRTDTKRVGRSDKCNRLDIFESNSRMST
jgi:hypothetical protein